MREAEAMKNRGFVYIVTNKPYGTIYIGVTDDLVRRIGEHCNGVFPGSFTKQYGLDMLVWYEIHTGIANAMKREKQLKKWERQWKIRLINDVNPHWRDLFEDICRS
jgi:putative endonuclease